MTTDIQTRDDGSQFIDLTPTAEEYAVIARRIAEDIISDVPRRRTNAVRNLASQLIRLGGHLARTHNDSILARLLVALEQNEAPPIMPAAPITEPEDEDSQIVWLALPRGDVRLFSDMVLHDIESLDQSGDFSQENEQELIRLEGIGSVLDAALGFQPAQKGTE